MSEKKQGFAERQFTRRRMLATAGLGAAGLLLGDILLPRRKAAAEGKPDDDRLFIFVYFEGGWDILMSLDPRDPTQNDPNKSQIDLGWDRLGSHYATMGWNGPGSGNGLVKVPNPVPGGVTQFGPAIGNLRKHHADMCLVNGVNMATLTHEVGRRLFITGQQPLGLSAQGSSTPTVIAREQGAKTLIPNLSFRVETYAVNEPSYASGLKVASVDDLNRALSMGRIVNPPDMQAAIDAARTAGGCSRRQIGATMVNTFESSRQRGRAMTAAHLEKHFDFLADDSHNPNNLTEAELADMAAVRQRYGIIDPLGAEAQAAVAYQALKYGVAQCVSLMLADTLDTHGVEWGTEQPRRLERGFNALSVLIDDLQAEGLWDKTTVLVWSEFSRTALLNARIGRDHNLCNSAILMGAGIKPGQLIGASAEGMRPLRLNLQTGQVDDNNGDSLSAKNVLATVFASANLDYDHLRAGPIVSALARP